MPTETWYVPGIVSRSPIPTARSQPVVVCGGVSLPAVDGGLGGALGGELGTTGVGVDTGGVGEGDPGGTVAVGDATSVGGGLALVDPLGVTGAVTVGGGVEVARTETVGVGATAGVDVVTLVITGPLAPPDGEEEPAELPPQAPRAAAMSAVASHAADRRDILRTPFSTLSVSRPRDTARR